MLIYSSLIDMLYDKYYIIIFNLYFKIKNMGYHFCIILLKLNSKMIITNLLLNS